VSDQGEAEDDTGDADPALGAALIAVAVMAAFVVAAVPDDTTSR
jgi:hypothetical protein